jgi:hypothetical protein
MGTIDQDLQTACLTPPSGVSPRHLNYSEQLVGIVRRGGHCPRSLETASFNARPTIRCRPLHTEAFHPRLSIWCVNANHVKSTRAADHGIFTCHAGLAASSVLRFTIRRALILPTIYLDHHEAQRVKNGRIRQPIGTQAEDKPAPLVLPPQTSLKVFRRFMQRMEDIVGTESDCL